MKILILQDDFPPRALGGPARVASELARALRARGNDVQIITAVPTRAEAGEYDYEGVKVHALHSSYAWRWQAYLGLYNPATIPQVTRILNEFKPDIVHAHNIHYRISYHALKIAKQSGVRVLLTTHDVMLFHYGKLHDFYDPRDLSKMPPVNYHVSPWRQLMTYRFRYNPFRNFIIKRYLKYCDRIIAVSYELRNALAANGIHATDVVYSGIDIEEWAGKPELGKIFRTEHDLGERPVLLFAGRLSEAKGGEQVLAMLAEVAKNIPGILLLVAGRKDAYGESMEKKAIDLGLTNNIKFTNWIEGDELQGAYYAANVVLFPSICFDTFGLVNIEAMAAGKPVVATSFGGAKEAVEDGVTGTLVNPRNIQMFSEAVLDFLNNSEKARVFGEAGLQRVRECFTLEKFVDRTLELYQP
jgi:spore coat protein SA